MKYLQLLFSFASQNVYSLLRKNWIIHDLAVVDVTQDLCVIVSPLFLTALLV